VVPSAFRSILVVIFVVLIGSSTTSAQPPCDPGFVKLTQEFSAPVPGGGCCTITVVFCYQLEGTTLRIVTHTVTVPADCPLVVGPGLFNWLRKKIVYRLSQGGILPSIPNCPGSALLTVETSVSSCYARTLSDVPDGPVNIYNPCGTSVCTKRCAVCLSTSDTDPCSDPANEPMLQYVGCQNIVAPCEPDTSKPDCIYNTCDSN
jgi:hypothetical protein